MVTTNTKLETTSKLEIIPLYEEARSRDDLQMGHGVSYLIRTDSSTVLLDVGNNPDNSAISPLAHNMGILGIEWDSIDAIVISHRHPDHTGGDAAWKGHKVSVGELPTAYPEIKICVPVPLTFGNNDATHTPNPTLVRNDVATTGAMPYSEFLLRPSIDKNGREQAVIIHVKDKGLVLITGCGHPTLETLVTQAETVYQHPVIGVVGGLHYRKSQAKDLQPHIEFLKKRQPQLVALSPHDSGPDAIEAFRSAFSEAYQVVEAGRLFQFP